MNRERTPFDLGIDGAGWQMLKLINRRLELGLRPQWWRTTGHFRELVRAGVNALYDDANTPAKWTWMMDRWREVCLFSS